MTMTRKEHGGHDLASQDRAFAPTQADVDEIERFLREQFQAKAGQPASASANADPLMAELARIVGQDVRPAAAAPEMPRAHDPFAAPAEADYNDPLRAFEEELRRFDAAHRAPAPVHEPEVAAVIEAAAPVVADAGAYDLRGVATHEAYQPAAQLHDPDYVAIPAEAIRVPEPAYANDVHLAPPLEPEGVIAEDLAPAAAVEPRSRKVMLLLGGAAAFALVGVIGSVAFGTKGGKSGDVPVIAAKTQPTKEKPADPGGVEVPGQDRQVLARKTDETKGAASIVTKEEQPVDLNQTPKREVSRVILPAQGQATGTSQAAPIIMPQGSAQPNATPQQPVTAGGFEAKRVRSVKIGSDGETQPTPAAPPPARSSTPSLASAPQPAPAVAPKVEAPKSDARPTTAARPVQQAATTTPQPVRNVQTRPVPAAPAAAPDDGNGPMSLRPPAGGTARPAPTRTASATTPTATPAATGGGGGFAVQLAAPGSEAEARTTASRLKQRFSDALDGYTPGVRKADVSGKTVYRVRVGGLSREDANSLCTRIKSDGGSCFVASN